LAIVIRTEEWVDFWIVAQYLVLLVVFMQSGEAHSGEGEWFVSRQGNQRLHAPVKREMMVPFLGCLGDGLEYNVL
jgi:hypothetical protein